MDTIQKLICLRYDEKQPKYYLIYRHLSFKFPVLFNWEISTVDATVKYFNFIFNFRFKYTAVQHIREKLFLVV